MPEIVTLTLPQTNCFLIRLEHGYLLVDCGRLQDKDRFLQTLDKLGVSVTDLSYLFLTHHHNDHCGLLNFLVTANPSIRVIMSKKCAQYLAVGTHCKHAGERYANAALGLIVGAYTRLNKNWPEIFPLYDYRREDIIIEADNDNVLPRFGIEGKILMTPGHTVDSISLISGQAAFVGDAARGMLNFAGRPYYPILLYDSATCRQSWQKLACAGAKQVFPAHGKPFHINKLF